MSSPIAKMVTVRTILVTAMKQYSALCITWMLIMFSSKEIYMNKYI